MALHLDKPKFSSLKNALCTVWLKLFQRFCWRWLLNAINFIALLQIYPPGENLQVFFFGLQFFWQFLQGVLALHLNNTNLNSSTQECFMPCLVKVLEKKMRTWRDKNNEEDGQRTELAWDFSSGELKTDEIHTFVKSTALDNGQFQRLPIAKMLKVKKTNIVIPVERSNSH